MGLVILAGPAIAQNDSNVRRVLVEPSLTISETITSRDGGSSSSSRNEAITTVSPGVRLSSRTGRLQGSLTYSLDGVLYARDTDANAVRHRLSATGMAVLIERHLSVDMSANISRQPVSAFGVLVAEPNLATTNSTDVRTYSVSPVLRGTVAGTVNLQARAQVAGVSTGTATASDSTTRSASVQISPASVGTRLGWSFDVSRVAVDYDLGRTTEADRAVLGASFSVLPDLRLTARAGVEDSDLVSLQKERTNTYGVGLLWTPTVRTKLALDADRRPFGNAHGISFEHRMRRSVWRFSDRQDITSGASAAGATVPAYDLFFSLFQSQEPDPVLREQMVNSFLQRNNLDPGTLVNGGFLTSASAVQRRQELSLAIEGLRTTVLFSGSATASRRAFGTIVLGDDLSAGSLRQHAFTVGLMHRLTPTSTLGLTVTSQRSESQASAGLFSRLNSISANWTDRIGRRTNLSLGLRHSDFESAADAYRENALLANVRMTF